MQIVLHFSHLTVNFDHYRNQLKVIIIIIIKNINYFITYVVFMLNKNINN